VSNTDSPYYYSDQTDNVEALLEAGVASLEIDLRYVNCLEKHGITTVRQLLERKREDLRGIYGFGDRALSQILHALQRKGIRRQIEDDAASKMSASEAIAAALPLLHEAITLGRQHEILSAKLRRVLMLLEHCSV